MTNETIPVFSPEFTSVAPKIRRFLIVWSPSIARRVKFCSCVRIWSLPTLSRYSNAGFMAMASTIAAVPASKRWGKSACSNPLLLTDLIMFPPPRNGGIDSRISRFPASTPIPVGPSILCPLKTTQSASQSTAVALPCGTLWAASTRTFAPTRCAASAILRTGLIVPSTFETAVILTSFVRGLRILSSDSRSS